MSSMIRHMSKEEKRRAMIKYLNSQGALFGSFLDSSESEAKRRSAKGKSASLSLMIHRRRMSVERDDDDVEANEVELVHLQSQPSCIQGTMRDYQIAALNWLLNQYQLGLNSILADEMGRWMSEG